MPCRRLLACCLLLLSLGPAWAADDAPLTSGYTGGDAPFRPGMWWNPDLSGSGMDMHLSGDRMFLVWYTYESDGAPVWYLAEGETGEDTWTAPLLRFTWDAVAGAATPGEVGEVTVAFQGPRAATFEWQLRDASGSYPIEPLLVSEGISAYDRTGHWFPPGEPGYGITLNTQGSVEFAIAYLYDAEGEPRWLLSKRIGELPETLELQMFEGSCPACAYAGEPTPTAAGSLKREFDGPISGQLTLDATFPAPLSGEWRRTEVPIRMASNRPDGRTHPAAMAPFADAAALETYLKRALAETPPAEGGSGPVFSAPPPQQEFSMTTVQEAGVDEADTVKTDGGIIYAIQPGQAGNDVRVLEIDHAAGTTAELARITFDDESPRLQEMYLARGGDGSAQDLLVGLFHDEIHGFFGPPWFQPPSWMNETVEVRIWDVSSPASPALVRTLSLDGGLVDSRRIGGKLYLVTRHTPTPPSGLDYGASTEEAVASNLALLEELSLEDMLPDLRVDGSKVGELVSPSATWLPPVVLDDESPSLVSVSAIDLRATGAGIDTLSLAGQTEAIYVSPDNIYLASMPQSYPGQVYNLIPDYPTYVRTDIHKLRLTEQGPEYRGSASVEGHLGYHQDRKSFRMGEFQQGHLGVVTSATGMWGSLGDHRLTILKETEGTPDHRLLREVAHLPSPEQPKTLGKPDEILYATRFLDDRLYAVTFKQVDPLYVVDLANPARPRITGEVDVFGYSDFLFPVGEGLILGIGKDAAPADGPGDGRFAWYQGIRIGLFDVSDPANPAELDNVILGKRGSDSPALVDHHAFSFLPAAEGRPARFGIPVRRHDVLPGFGVSPDPTHHYPWVETGLYLFSVEIDGFHAPRLREDGGIFSAWHPAYDEADEEAYLAWEYARSILTEDNAFFLNRGEVWSAPWQAPNQTVGPQ